MKRIAILTIALLILGSTHKAHASGYATVAPSGQTIYWQFNGIDNGGGVMITFPGNQYGNNCWGSYTKPTDTLAIPDSIMFQGTPYAVTKIGEDAFRGCTGLTHVIIPTSVTQIESTAFSGCTGLTSVTIPSSVSNIGNSAFAGCSGIISVVIQNSNPNIGGNVFSGCTSLASVTLPNTMTMIGSGMFRGCISLSSFTFPDSLNSIGSEAFYHCTGLSYLQIPNTVGAIGIWAFAYSGLDSLILPNAVTSIGASTFNSCTNLTAIALSDSTISIGAYAFYNCPNLSSITIPESVRNIGKYAFAKCHSLTSITLSDSISSIGCSVFDSCTSLTTVNYNPVNCTVITEPYTSNLYVFDGCTNLSAINIGANVQTIPALMFRRCRNIDTIVIPNTVTSIGGSAFSECTNLSAILIPNSVTSIGYAAFNCDSNLHSIVIPNSVSYIGDNAFYWCSSLVSATLPDSITSIGDNVFYHCNSLSSITIPAEVTSIGEGAFAYCDSLLDVYVLPSTPPSISNLPNYWYTDNPRYYKLSFYGMQNHAVFHVPCGTLNTYYNLWSSHYTYSEPIVSFVFSLLTSDSTGGTASIIRDIRCQDSSIVVLATLTDTHYHFSHWSNGNIANPDTLYLARDSTVTAIFERNQYIVSAYGNDTTMGYVSGSNVYLYQDTALLTAIPFEHYHFVHWSDGNTDNPRQYVVTDNITLTATFAIDTHVVSVSTNNIAYGGVDGGGNFAYGTPCTVSATAYTGYHFSQWSNGITANPYTFAVLQDTELIAIFEQDGTQGISNVIEDTDYLVYSRNGRIFIESEEMINVQLFDVNGRIIARKQESDVSICLEVPSSGVYLVKVGNHPTRKIVVIK